MRLKIKTFSMVLAAMSASTYTMALPSHNKEEKTANNKEKSEVSTKEESVEKNKKEERNVMLNAADANKPREIQIGLPSEDVTVYENGLPAVYSSSVHKLSAHWRSDASLKGTDLMTPSESAITTGNIAYAVSESPYYISILTVRTLAASPTPHHSSMPATVASRRLTASTQVSTLTFSAKVPSSISTPRLDRWRHGIWIKAATTVHTRLP